MKHLPLETRLLDLYPDLLGTVRKYVTRGSAPRRLLRAVEILEHSLQHPYLDELDRAASILRSTRARVEHTLYPIETFEALEWLERIVAVLRPIAVMLDRAYYWAHEYPHTARREPAAYHGLAAYAHARHEDLLPRARACLGAEICAADQPIGPIGLIVAGPVPAAWPCDVWSYIEEGDQEAYRESDTTAPYCEPRTMLDLLAWFDAARAWRAADSDSWHTYSEIWIRPRRILAVWHRLSTRATHLGGPETATTLAYSLDVPCVYLPPNADYAHVLATITMP